MSNQTIFENTGQQAHIGTDTSKIFIWEPRTIEADFNNVTGSDVVLEAGMLMGRISASGFVVQVDSGNVTGEEFPLGVLMQDITVPTATTVSVTIAVSGDVAEELLILKAGTDLDDVVIGRRLRDRIGGDTVGIILVAGTQLTDFDNV